MWMPRGWLIFLAASQDARHSRREASRSFAAGKIRNRHRTHRYIFRELFWRFGKAPAQPRP